MNLNPISTEDMQVLELNAASLGVTHSMLMHNAGREVARTISQNEKIKGKIVTILCGLGGNGGDGMVAARYLQELGAQVTVLLIGSENDISNKDTIENWNILNNIEEIQRKELKSEASIKSMKIIQESDILLDAMMGFGLRSKLRQPMLSAVKIFNKSDAVKYAVDVPTGIDSDTGKVYGEAVTAKITIALHAPKIGSIQCSDYTGEIRTVSIGIPDEADFICGLGDLSLFNKPRSPNTKKGDYGRILVIGGSSLYSGAPTLTGLAALRTGADLVSIAAPESVASTIRTYSPNLMVSSLPTNDLRPDSFNALSALIKKQDVIAVGPGLGTLAETKEVVRLLIDEIVKEDKYMVVDADGLKGIAGSGIRLNPEKCVLTPHLGEVRILLDTKQKKKPSQKERIVLAMDAAKQYNSVVLLKGHIDIISQPDGLYKLNRTGVPAMSVGGTGDVLTGIVAALLAHNKGAFKAASAAAYISGRAGEIAFDRLGDHLMATDCIDSIPQAMKR